MPTQNPKQAARNRGGSRVRFARYFSQVCKEAAKATGTVYHGSTEAGADYDTKIKNLDTVYDPETLMNQRGAIPITERLIRDYRDPKGFAQDKAEVEAKLAGGRSGG